MNDEKFIKKMEHLLLKYERKTLNINTTQSHPRLSIKEGEEEQIKTKI